MDEEFPHSLQKFEFFLRSAEKMTKTIAAAFITILFLTDTVAGLATMQTVTFDIEGMS